MKSLILFIFPLIFELIHYVNSLPCTQENIGKYWTDCLNNTRDLYFYWIEECDQSDSSSIQLPASLLSIECKSCEKESIFDFDLKENKSICTKCPTKTYSAGASLIVNGIIKEWKDSNPNFKKFSNHCYIEQSDNEFVDKNCKGWNPSNDNSYIIAGETTMQDSFYLAEFSVGVELVKKGKVKFKYQKVNLSENANYSGVFRFLINYLEFHNNYQKSDDWIEKSFEVEPGYHTFIWQYTKRLNAITSDYHKLFMKIESIEIEGLDTADFECRPCSNSTSSLPQCKDCDENYYYEENSVKCLKCPDSTYSYSNSIGVNSCIEKKPCMERDYNTQVKSNCLMSNKTQLIEYNWIMPQICNEAKGIHLPDNKYINCLACSKGQYMGTFGSNEGRCEFCEEGTYKKENEKKECRNCSEGKILKFLKIENISNNDITKYFTTVKNWGIHKGALALELQSKSSYLEKEIKILEEKGSIDLNVTISRDILYPPEYFVIDLINKDLEKKIYSSSFTNKGEVMLKEELPKGDYKLTLTFNGQIYDLEVKEPVIKINHITIFNSTEGGGYDCIKCQEDLILDKESNKCVKCPVGTEKDKLNNKCIPCKDGFFSDELTFICLKCPPLTVSNTNKDTCVILDILHLEKSALRFIIKGLSDIEKTMLCDSDEYLCYDNFLGPIISPNELSFLSFQEKSFINLTDFSYSEDLKEKRKGFVYNLKNVEVSLNNDTSFSNVSKVENMKMLVNIGSRIESIKLFSKNKKGFVLKYSDGEICYEDPSQKYNSILFVTCHKETDTIFQVNSPNFLRKIKNNCTYVFEWKTRYGCPSCLKNDSVAVKMPCINSERTVYYREDSECIIENPKNKSGENITYREEDVLLLSPKEEEELSFYFTGETRILDSVNNTDMIEEIVYPYVDYRHQREVCQMYEDYDNYIVIIVIAVPVFYFIIAIIVICYCVKLRRISNQYERLVDERDSTNTEPNNENDKKIEMSISVQANK